MSNRLVQLELYHLRLPFRHKFSHAAASRGATDTVIAAALLADGTVGFGEGLPREYVTGETVESVLFNIEDILVDSIIKLEPKSWSVLLDCVDNLPFENNQGQVINSARCCVELALLDAYGKYFHRCLSSIAEWMGYASFLNSDLVDTVRVSGVLDGSNPGLISRRLRKMWWYGLRDFKLKMGCPHDRENLEQVYRRLRCHLSSEKATLRVDANGAWDIDEAISMSTKLASRNVCCLEQPLALNDGAHMRVLADLSDIPLMADESLITLDDAKYLVVNDLIDYFNIRISKNGGLIPALRLAEMAFQYDRGVQLGAMVGESGILAAAGRQFLQMVPDVSFTEICYGNFLLQEDIVDCKMRFGFGGKMRKMKDSGLGVMVKRDKIAKYIVESPRKIDLA